MKRMLGKGLLSVKGEKDVRKTFFGNDLILQRRPETDPAFYKGTQLCKADRGTFLYILEAAAYTHDIGIKPAEEKYGSSEGKLQEQEGPAVARGMLKRLGFAENVIERVCYLIGHHHTYTGIEGRDYQILVEADFLVNLYEDGRTDGDGRFVPDKAAVETAYQRIFATETGKWICRSMFALGGVS